METTIALRRSIDGPKRASVPRMDNSLARRTENALRLRIYEMGNAMPSLANVVPVTKSPQTGTRASSRADRLKETCGR